MDVPKPRSVTLRKLRQGAEADRADREFWAALTPEQRIAECWRLSMELCVVPHRIDLLTSLTGLTFEEA
jgi:hypothetical protein